jgi:DNA (cytosine-5)-methyltransferase 1
VNDTRIATTSFVRNRISFGSVCSGIEAASVAWDRLGWRCAWVAEIDAFPSSVLAQRFPRVPNLGDMTAIAARILAGEIEAPDVLVGGTPCQAFSLAGLRAGLSDSRGQLTLAFVILANAIDAARAIRGKPPCVVLWENVPGVLSDKTNAFGHLLGGLAGEDDALVPPGRKWSNAGAVFGPKRSAAWRLLDAQYFRVAQRRRRCFVIASARDGFDPTAVLFDWTGVRRDSAPSRGAWSDAPAGALRSSDGGSDVDHALAGHLVPAIAPALTSGVERPRGDGVDPLIVCMAHGQGGAEVALDRAPTLTCNHEAPIACYAFQPRIARNGRGDMGDVVNALTAQAGETGKGDAAPCVAIIGRPGSQASIAEQAAAFAFKASHYTRGKDGAPSEVAPPLSADADKGDQDTLVLAPRAIAFDSRQDPVSSEHVAGALGSGRSQAQAVCVAFQDRFRGDDGRGYGRAPAVSLEQIGTLETVKRWHVVTRMAVRRLTPVECERLQGFPDGWTAVVYRGKPAADGPRYKALGNSMAVPCMAFLGRRIDAYFNGELLRGFA